MSSLGALILHLLEARDFEEAAKRTLVAMLGAAEERFVGSPLASKGRLLRGVLHLRPDDSYQRLFGIEHPHGERVEGTEYLTSANVWRWVSEHRTAVSINVKSGTLRTWLAEGASEPEKLRGSTGPGNLRQLDNIVRRAYAIMIADPGDAASPSTLSRRHVEHALGYELRPEALGLVATLWGATRAFVTRRSAAKRLASGCRSIWPTRSVAWCSVRPSRGAGTGRRPSCSSIRRRCSGAAITTACSCASWSGCAG